MKKRIVKLMKKTVSSIMAVAMILAGSFMMDTETEAADVNIIKNDKGVAYQQFADWDTCKDEYWGKKIPEYAGSDESGYGYVFGGWFTSTDEATFTAMENADASGNVYAKFVPAYVLSVKCQNKAGTTEGTASTSLKIVSSVDSLSYQAYGFDLHVIVLDENGNYVQQVGFSSNGEQATEVYEKFKIYEKDENESLVLKDTKEPNQVFGDASAYFTTWEIKTVNQGAYKTIISAKPYWITKDNMKVYGLTKYAHVEDGYLHTEGETTYRYVNVPVNVRNTKSIAAGILNVDYSQNTGFELFEVEGGVVFEEMAWKNQDSSVKLVGNVKDITTDKTVNDIYANLRFKVPCENVTDFATGYNFEVVNEKFSGIDENLMDNTVYDVWNVKY